MKSIDRRDFLKRSAVFGTVATTGNVLPVDGFVGKKDRPGERKSLVPKLELGGTVSVSKPSLKPSQLNFRLGLVRSRMSSYPCDSMDFIMIDLERPDNTNRHADWCGGDLTGRLLEFLCCSEGVDGKYDPRLKTLFERILAQRKPSGSIGRISDKHDPDNHVGCSKLFHGLMRYYDLYQDPRALEAASGLAEELWSVKDLWERLIKEGKRFMDIPLYIVEPMARLYAATNDPRWKDFCSMIKKNIRSAEERRVHSHGFLSTLRGFQAMTLLTGDMSWYQIPEENMEIILRGNFSMPDGNITEAFPQSKRNEGCSIADWLMFNLNHALIKGDSEAYNRAERTFWNALAFNQILTGGFGHRGVTVNGYSSQQFSEAWWCCTENAGLAFAEYARHTVTYRNKKLHINFLTPGTFEVPIPNGKWVKVSIETEYPMAADARIEIEGLPADSSFEVRTPYWVKDSTIDRKQQGNRTSLHFKGTMAHRIENCHLGVILTYGPLILVPVEGGEAVDPPEANVPQGYIPGKLPLGVPNIVIEEKNMKADGFVKLPRCPSDVPVPAWTYFDERVDAPTKVAGAPVMVKLKYADGKSVNIRFVPMCYFTSNLTLFDTPVVFRSVEKV